jgi:hypothetical protein
MLKHGGGITSNAILLADLNIIWIASPNRMLLEGDSALDWHLIRRTPNCFKV